MIQMGEFMGPLFVILFWLIFLTPIAIIFGALVGFKGFPLYYRIRRMPTEQSQISRHKKMIISVVSGILLWIIANGMVISSFVLEAIYSNDYEKSTGFADYWRWPLEYPYDMGTTQIDSDADIRVWHERKTILMGITEYYKEDNFIIGRRLPNQYDEKNWYDTLITDPITGDKEKYYIYDESSEAYDSLVVLFIFDCNTGRISNFTDRDEFKQALNKIGIKDIPEMKSIKSHWLEHVGKNSILSRFFDLFK